MSQQAPQGSLPADLQDSIAAMIREVGMVNLTPKVLRSQLTAKYSIDFEQHKEAVKEALDSLIATKEFLVEMARLDKARKEGMVSRGKGKKRSATKEKVKAEKPHKEQKSKKPDNYPKAALSAYMIFSGDRREELKVKEPGLKITEVSKRIGDLWKAASEETKTAYSARATEDKVRFEKEMAAYLESGGEKFSRSSKKSKNGKAKKAKDPNAPKRPMNAYMFFVSDFRKNHTEMKLTEVTKGAGAKWKTMSDEEKAPYATIAANDVKRYETECASKGVPLKSSATARASKPKRERSASASSSGSYSYSYSGSSSGSGSSSSSVSRAD